MIDPQFARVFGPTFLGWGTAVINRVAKPTGKRQTALQLVRIIILRNRSEEADSLVSILQERTLLTCAWDLPELRTLLKGGQYDFFLCARTFEGGDWHSARKEIQLNCPGLPIVIFSTRSGPQTFQRIPAGIADVLVPPFQEGVLMLRLRKFMWADASKSRSRFNQRAEDIRRVRERPIHRGTA